MIASVWGSRGSNATTPSFGISVQEHGNKNEPDLVNRMTIIANGNVGFGTDQPKNNIHIKRDGNNNNYLRIEAGGNGNNNNPETFSGILLTENNDWSWEIRHNTKTDHLEFCYHTSDGNWHPTTVPMVITAKADEGVQNPIAANTGRVGIGLGDKTHPTARLDVHGNVKISNGNNNNNETLLDVAGKVHATEFDKNSDSTLKREIRDMHGSLAQLLRLRPVTYYWKDTSIQHGFDSRLQRGFIAQEVQKIFPELVLAHDGTNLGVKRQVLAMDYMSILPVVVSATQKLNKRQELQNKEIQAKDAEIEALKDQVQELRVRMQKL